MQGIDYEARCLRLEAEVERLKEENQKLRNERRHQMTDTKNWRDRAHHEANVADQAKAEVERLKGGREK